MDISSLDIAINVRAAEAAQQIAQVKQHVASVGNAANNASQVVDRAVAKIAARMQDQIMAMRAGGRATAEYFDQWAKAKGAQEQLAPLIAQMRELESVQRKATSALAANEGTFAATGTSAKQLAFAMRQVPAQMTDIVVSLQSGQRPMTVLLQQGGQLKDMFGGIGPAFKSVATYALGLINPYTIAAAAVAGLAVAMSSAESQLRAVNALDAQLRATGRGAELGSDQIKALRIELEHLPGVSRDSANAIISAFAKTREIGAPLFRDLSALVADYATATDTAAPEAAKALAKSFADPKAGAKELESQLGILTAAQVISIEKMTDLGDRAGAQKVLLDALRLSVSGLSNEAMTPLQKSTNDLGNAWSDMTRSMDNSSTLRAANSLLADMLSNVASLVKALPNLRIPGQGSFGGAAAGMGIGMLAFGVPGMMLGGAIGGRDPNAGQMGGATGSWEDQSKALDEQVKAVLAATTSYKSAIGAMDDMRAKASTLTATLNALRDAGKGNSVEAQELADRLKGVNEKIRDAQKSLAGKEGETSYQALIARIKERIAAQDQELSGNKKLTEQEKFSLKVMSDAQELLKKFPGLHMDEVKALLAKSTSKALEIDQRAKNIKMMQAEAEFLMQVEEDQAQDAVARSKAAEQVAIAITSQFAALKDSNEQLELEGKLIGATEVQRQKAIEHLRIEQALRKQIDDINKNASPATRQMDIDRAKEAADEAMRQADTRIAMQEQLRILGSIDSTAQQVWTNVFEGGSDAFKKLGQTLKSAVLDLLYQMTIRPFVLNIAANVIGGPAVQALSGMGGASGIGSLLSSGLGFGSPSGALLSSGGLLGGLAGGLGLAGGTTVGTAASLGAGFEGFMASSGFLPSAGGTLAGLGGALSVLGPLALGLGALSAVIGKSGETRHGGQFTGTDLISAPSGGGYQDAIPAIAGTMQSINTLLQQLGSSSRLGVFQSGFEDSKKGMGFAYARGTLTSGAQFGNWMSEGYMQNRGTMSSEEAAAAFGQELKQATIAALQASDLKGALSDWLKSLGDVDQLSGGALDDALARINNYIQQKAALDERQFQLTATEEQKLAHQREQERAALDPLLRAQYDEIVAIEDQKAATERATAAAKAASDALRDVAAAYDSYLSAQQQQQEQERIDALNTQVSTLQSVIQAERQRAESLKAYLRELTYGQAALNTPAQQYALTKQEFMRLSAMDPNSAERKDNIQQAAEAFRQASQAMFASSTNYFVDLAQIKGAVEASQIAAQVGQVSAQAQYEVAQQQLEAINAVRNNTNSTVQAIQALSNAIFAAIGKGAATGLTAQQVAATTGGVMDQWVNQGAGNSTYSSSSGASGTVDPTNGLTIYGAQGGAWSVPDLQNIASGFLSRGDSAGLYAAAAAAGISPEVAHTLGIPGFDVGTAFINETGPAIVHRGERIVTAKDNEMLSPLLEEVRDGIRALIRVSADGSRQVIDATERVAENTSASTRAAFLKETAL